MVMTKILIIIVISFIISTIIVITAWRDQHAAWVEQSLKKVNGLFGDLRANVDAVISDVGLDVYVEGVCARELDRHECAAIGEDSLHALVGKLDVALRNLDAMVDAIDACEEAAKRGEVARARADVEE